MPDYSKGRIYKIVNNVNDKVYYGSTIQPLHKRMNQHRDKHNLCMSKKIGIDLKECKIILVENINCNSKEELEKRERWYIENNECVNKNIPGRKKKEYYEKNKEVIIKKIKKYSEKNKEKIAENSKKYYEKNKEKLAEKKKKYYEKNKAKKTENVNKYYEKNKAKIAKKRAETVTCECGAVVTKCYMTRHKKSKKHLELIVN